MLVLTRYTDESVVVTVPPSDGPRTVRLKVIGYRYRNAAGRWAVCLGFDADIDITIDRSEVAGLRRRRAPDATPDATSAGGEGPP